MSMRRNVGRKLEARELETVGEKTEDQTAGAPSVNQRPNRFTCQLPAINIPLIRQVFNIKTQQFFFVPQKTEGGFCLTRSGLTAFIPAYRLHLRFTLTNLFIPFNISFFRS